MGAEESKMIEGSSLGFHVLKVTPNSKADEAGLEPYFDWILFCNKQRLDTKDSISILTSAISSQPVELIVYSSKRRDLRVVKINVSPTLGCKLRFCDYETASEHIWHVLDVQDNSPAAAAGLISDTDYILGTPKVELVHKDDLFDLIDVHDHIPLALYVYNSVADCVREVLVMPNKTWGGKGSMGCDIGYGLLHRIPKASNTTTEVDQAVADDSILEMVSLDAFEQDIKTREQEPKVSKTAPFTKENGDESLKPTRPQEVVSQPPTALPIAPGVEASTLPSHPNAPSANAGPPNHAANAPSTKASTLPSQPPAPVANFITPASVPTFSPKIQDSKMPPIAPTPSYDPKHDAPNQSLQSKPPPFNSTTSNAPLLSNNLPKVDQRTAALKPKKEIVTMSTESLFK